LGSPETLFQKGFWPPEAKVMGRLGLGKGGAFCLAPMAPLENLTAYEGIF